MTTFEPGARVVLTHGLAVRPFSTAFFASRPAPTMTYGLLVLVQLVMAAIATWPWSIVTCSPFASVAATGLLGRSEAPLVSTPAGASAASCVPGAAGSEAGKDSALASSMPVPATAAVAGEGPFALGVVVA